MKMIRFTLFDHYVLGGSFQIVCALSQLGLVKNNETLPFHPGQLAHPALL